MRTEKRDSIIKFKLIYTALILLVYLIGKSMPLYGIDVEAYLHKTIEAEDLLVQTISGDIYQCSLFALGISPYMIASVVVQIVMSLRGTESKARISPKKMNRMSLAMTFMVAVFQALVRIGELQFTTTDHMLLLSKLVATIEMVTGVMIIVWLSDRNKRYGIGGQTTLIFVNILDGIITTLREYNINTLIVPMLVSLLVIIIVMIMENAEKRIPLQRISIHNIYADKNYLAIKLNPIGVMPAMFSTAFFILPQLLITGLGLLFPDNKEIIWWQENVTLSKPLGIVVYIVILYCLTIGFSRVFVNPREITEQFLKSGDSILNLHAGSDTKKYLSREINRISILSATVMSVCLGVPMMLQMIGDYESSLAMLPSSIMMLTGIWCNLYREVTAIKDLDAYKPFI